MIGQKEIYDKLKSLQIEYEYYEHPPIPLAEDALKYPRGENTTYCKNLFFRNHKGSRHYFVLLRYDQNLSIKDFEAKMHQGKMSLASGWRMEKYLNTTPGSVSPLGLVNDITNHVHLYIENSLKDATKLSFHPNDNRASLILTNEGFIRYLKAIGNSYEFRQLV
ncbi:MAG: prolyl-tRNA synthetase associated domain-containing protein [Bacteroidales bacterium]|nr:prolyl-tRNA synthetase associated domain-containing protein [Bacteroidales bacterium]